MKPIIRGYVLIVGIRAISIGVSACKRVNNASLALRLCT